MLINPKTHSVIIIDFGLAGATFVETDNNVCPAHDINEVIWHFMFSWLFSASLIASITNALLPCTIVGPGALHRDVKGKWVHKNRTFYGALTDKMPIWSEFYPADARILTRYGHNCPMYPLAVVDANAHAPAGDFQGLLLEDSPPQKEQLDWLPPVDELKLLIKATT